MRLRRDPVIRPEPLYIIAGTLAQATATAIDRGLPASPWTREWCWVHGVDTFRGRRDINVIFGYGCTERRDWVELVEWLTYAGYTDSDAPVSIT